MMDLGYSACAIINNDVRLSAGTIHWLMRGVKEHGAGIVAPVYDCYWPHQQAQRPWVHPARYVPKSIFRAVPFCDGTVVLVSRAVVDLIGVLDHRTFNWHGYGADIDFGIRARIAGQASMVSEGCFASHARGATIRELEPDSERRGHAEYREGMERKWGSDWRRLVGGPDGRCMTPCQGDRISVDGPPLSGPRAET
jgi:GT2 family glycosyltransferase